MRLSSPPCSILWSALRLAHVEQVVPGGGRVRLRADGVCRPLTCPLRRQFRCNPHLSSESELISPVFPTTCFVSGLNRFVSGLNSSVVPSTCSMPGLTASVPEHEWIGNKEPSGARTPTVPVTYTLMLALRRARPLPPLPAIAQDSSPSCEVQSARAEPPPTDCWRQFAELAASNLVPNLLHRH
jgi:hypothetical protein